MRSADPTESIADERGDARDDLRATGKTVPPPSQLARMVAEYRRTRARRPSR